MYFTRLAAGDDVFDDGDRYGDKFDFHDTYFGFKSHIERRKDENKC